MQYATYLQIEAALFWLHMMAAIVFNNALCLLPVAFCRLPRLAFPFFAAFFTAKHETTSRQKLFQTEYTMRLITLVALPFFSVGIQAHNCRQKFCALYLYANTQKRCVLRYGLTLGVLVVAAFAIDCWLQSKLFQILKCEL